jgi:NAD-dependent dihydropyrimidine dehydrogenase PreA subunit
MFSPNSPNAEEQSSAVTFGNSILTRFNDKSQPIERFDPPTHFIYGIERLLVSRPFAKMMYSKFFRVDKNCDKCMICVKKCPIENIYENNNGKLKWHSKCLLCATCELSCPKDAIHSAFDWIIFAPFMIYNIQHSKNKNIPFADVIHKKGRTILS